MHYASSCIYKGEKFIRQKVSFLQSFNFYFPFTFQKKTLEKQNYSICIFFGRLRKLTLSVNAKYGKFVQQIYEFVNLVFHIEWPCEYDYIRRFDKIMDIFLYTVRLTFRRYFFIPHQYVTDYDKYQSSYLCSATIQLRVSCQSSYMA